MALSEHSARRLGAGCAASLSALAALAYGPAAAQVGQRGLAPINPGAAQIAPLPQRAAPPAEPLREGVAAVVNADIVSTYDLRQRILLLAVSSGIQPTPQTLPELEREALRDLVDERLQMQEVRRTEQRVRVTLEPTDAEIDEEAAELAGQNNLNLQQLYASLAASGVDPQTLRNQIKSQIAWRRYVGGMYGNRVQVGEEQVNAALSRIEESAGKPQYLMGEIFIDAQRAGGQEAAVAGAQQLIQQLQQGAPFAAVARQFSSASTAINGGDAGWQTPGEIPEAVERAVEEMRPGQLSQPIPVNGGVYIVLLRDKRAGAGATLVNLKQAAVRLPAEPTPDEIAAARTKLLSLREQIGGCDALEARANAVEGVVAGDLGEADINDLAPAFRDAVVDLQTGQVSAPVRTAAGLHLIALCGRRSADPNQPTRADIESRLVEQELAMMARRQLRDLRNSASIENR